MTLKLAVAPQPAVTWEEAKAALGLSDDMQAATEAMIAAATLHLDGYSGILGWAIMEQEYDLTYDAFPDAEIELPVGPVVSVTGVYYVNPETGAEETLPTDQYFVDKGGQFGGWIVPGSSWPRPMATANAVRIRFKSGSTTCHPVVFQAILMMVRKMQVLAGAEALKQSETVEGIGSTRWAGHAEISPAIDGVVNMLIAPLRKPRL